jgi:hypothetical protein
MKASYNTVLTAHTLGTARRRLMVARYELGFVRRYGYPRQMVAYREKRFCEALDLMWRAQQQANAVTVQMDRSRG